MKKQILICKRRLYTVRRCYVIDFFSYTEEKRGIIAQLIFIVKNQLILKQSVKFVNQQSG